MARSLTGMLLGRVLVGIGLGVGPPVASLYVTEISPAHVRGTYGSFIQIATCLGLMAALVVGIPVRSIFGWWRICFWISTFPASMLALLMVFCVESPHWLYKQGRHSEAENELEKLLGASHAKDAIVELSKTERGDEADTMKLAELLCGRHSRVVFIGSTLFALQQLSGINAVFYFSSTVFRRAGVSSNLANVCVGIANLIGSVIALALMDKLGRKALLLWSFFGMAVSTVLQVLAASSSASDSVGFFLSVGGMMLFVLMFAVGAGPVPGLLLPEMFPNGIRAKAMAFCDKFCGWLGVPAFAGRHGAAAVVLNVGFILLASSGVCETKCAGNQRKITSRNRDCSPRSRLVFLLYPTAFFQIMIMFVMLYLFSIKS